LGYLSPILQTHSVTVSPAGAAWLCLEQKNGAGRLIDLEERLTDGK
jgi:hypothetical protein